MAERGRSEHKNASRSRYLIKHAYGELLNEKDPAKITVTDIVERAKISRGTFYAHYLDVFDLNMSIQNNIIHALDRGVERLGMENFIADPTTGVRLAMKYLEANKAYFGLFVNSSQGEAFISRINNYIEDKVYPIIAERFSQQDNDRIKLFVIYTLGAYKRVLSSWFAGKINFTADECSDILMNIYMASRPPEVVQLEKEYVESLQKTE